MSGLYKIIKRALFPKDITCNGCGAELIAETRYNFCSSCMEILPFNDGKVCVSCGVPMENEADYCINCMNYDRAFNKNRSPLVYEGLSHNLIYGLKFGGKKYLAEELSKMLADEYIKGGYDSEVVVSVPMSEAEKKARGYNQAELLAANLCKRLNLPYTDKFIKTRDTSGQKELGSRERRENLKGAFLVTDKEAVKGKRVLLVDDVFTTGATANECALALKRAYARDVSVLTVCVTKQKLYGEKGNEIVETI